MANTNYYVNTASAGGDGTGGIDVIAGASAAYASMSAAEAARQGTVNIGDTVTFICKGTAADTTSLVFSGWTVNGDVVITSDVSSRHSGIYNTSKYRIESTSNVITISDNNVRIDYLQAKKTTTNNRRVILCGSGSTGSKITRNMLFNDFGGSVSAIQNTASSNLIDVAFNIIDGFTTVYEDSSSQGGLLSWYNNTIVNCTTIYASTKTNKSTFKNNLIYNSTNGITGAVHADSDYNSTDSSTFGTGYSTNTNDRVSQTFTFVNAGAGDYHIQSSDTGAKGHGVDLSGVTDSIDIDGDTIVAPWSIGADWISAGGGGVTVTGSTANYNYSGVNGSVDLTGEVTVTGQTASYNYTGVVGVIDLTGEVIVTGQTASYNYSGVPGLIDLTGEVIVTGATGSYDYSGMSGTIELGAEIIVVGQTADYDYSGIGGSIDITPLITVIGQTANYDFDGIPADIILQGSIIVTGSTGSYDYNALNGTIIIQGPITINPKNIIMVKRDSVTIKVKRDSGTIRVKRSSNIIRVQ